MDDNPTMDLDAVWKSPKTTVRFTYNSELPPEGRQFGPLLSGVS